MSKLRPVIFWLHLVAGVVAGVIIAIMSFTGVALAFEKEIIAWAERDVRRVSPPADAKRLPLDDLLARVREQQPDARPSGITVSADPAAAVLVSLGRTNALHVNPYTGAVQPQGAAGLREFMHVMIDWHRFLGTHGESRPTGKAITGACNVAFLVLALTGLFLWWPRNWTNAAVRAVALMNFKLRGKARDFNWHNAIGLWCAPVLIVLTVTAMPISYRWATELIYKMTGTEAPPPGAAPGMSGPPVEVPKPPPGTKPLGYDALLAAVQKEAPAWQQITFRIGGGGQRGGGGAGGAGSTNASPARAEGSGSRRREEADPAKTDAANAAPAKPTGEAPAATPSGTPRGEGRGGPQAVSVSIKERGGWPLFYSPQLTLDPFTGAVLKQEKFSDQNLGRQVRSWTRFLHTGEALGPVGQALAGLASFGALFLVWTGFALTWRRFFGKKASTSATDAAAATPS